MDIMLLLGNVLRSMKLCSFSPGVWNNKRGNDKSLALELEVSKMEISIILDEHLGLVLSFPLAFWGLLLDSEDLHGWQAWGR